MIEPCYNEYVLNLINAIWREKKKGKTKYTITLVACVWAGAAAKVSRVYGEVADDWAGVNMGADWAGVLVGHV